MDRRRVLAVVAVAELLAMSLWFSATAVGPELADAWGLSAGQVGWLTTAVQVGFVAGALASSAVTLSDMVPPRYLFSASAAAGAVCTALLAGVESVGPAVALRFLTGVALAGVYPPGMKILAGWFDTGRGLAIGVLVGALSVGSALPHLLRGVGGVGRPRLVLYGAAVLATLGGVLVLFVRPGPHQSPTAPFDPRAISRLLADRPSMLANGGYFGHMWELYAVWTWMPAYLLASFTASGAVGDPATAAALATFGMIAAGGAGAALAGPLADRYGRTPVTVVSLAASASACLGAGVVFGRSPLVVVPFVLAWGVVVVADSAQFSAAVSELAEGSYVGTALTLQTAIGFLLTTVSIQLLPTVADAVGWQWAFAPLAIGPFLGGLSMLRLRTLPAARKLAGGRG
jgi:MFS family permease